MESDIEEIRIPEGALRVEIRGSGPALLCLHGLTANRSTWRPLADRIADRFTLYMPDLLSRGESEPRPDLGYRFSDELRRMRELVRELGLADYLAIGHSQGAALALGLAAGRGPAPRVPPPAGLVLINPVTPWTRRPPPMLLLDAVPFTGFVAGFLRAIRVPLTRFILENRVFASTEYVTEELVRRYAAPYEERSRARALVRILSDWRPAEHRGHLPPSGRPARVITGTRDPRVTVSEARRLADRLEAPLEVIEETSHGIPEERPDRTAAAVRDLHREITNSAREQSR